MKYMGIDYGTKKVGIAISDDDGRVAFPFEVVENSTNLKEKIIDLSKVNSVGKIIFGESKDYNMEDNDIMDEVKNLKSELEKDGFSVDLHPELLTSHQVSKETFSFLKEPKSRKKSKKDDNLDAKAAALMLQSYLDINN